MTIDFVQENLTIEPGDKQRLEVTVRNSGNVETFLDAGLIYEGSREDRFEISNWTVAIFNASKHNHYSRMNLDNRNRI